MCFIQLTQDSCPGGTRQDVFPTGDGKTDSEELVERTQTNTRSVTYRSALGVPAVWCVSKSWTPKGWYSLEANLKTGALNKLKGSELRIQTSSQIPRQLKRASPMEHQGHFVELRPKCESAFSGVRQTADLLRCQAHNQKMSRSWGGPKLTILLGEVYDGSAPEATCAADGTSGFTTQGGLVWVKRMPIEGWFT